MSLSNSSLVRYFLKVETGVRIPIVAHIPDSSSGRTAVFEAAYRGSITRPATIRGQLKVGCLPLKQVTMVRPHSSEPAGERGMRRPDSKPGSVGSTPTTRAKPRGQVAKAAVCKTVIAGSNPAGASSRYCGDGDPCQPVKLVA